MTLRLLRVWVWLELIAFGAGVGWIGSQLALMARPLPGHGAGVAEVAAGVGSALLLVCTAGLCVLALVEFFNHPWGRP